MRDFFRHQLARHVSALRQGDPYLLAALLIACLAAYPLLAGPGLLNTRGGGDSPFLLQRLQQLETALGDGHFPVRWMPDANYGYGYPFYNFYAPLSIYITALFRLLGFTFVRSIQLSQLLGFLVAAWGMFRLGKQWWGQGAAGFITAVSYTLAPFHLVNIYVRGDSLAEFWAMAFFPWVILTAEGLVGREERRAKREERRERGEEGGERREERGAGETYQVSRGWWLVAGGWWQGAGGRGRVIGFALAYAALILSHNISALIFTPFLGLFILLRWRQNKSRQPALAPRPSPLASPPSPLAPRHSPLAPRPSPLAPRPSPLPLLLALLLALALSAWFFLPALAEQSLAQLGPVTEGYFHYSNHFRGLDLVQPTFFFDYNPDGGRAFSMGLIQTATAILTLILLPLASRPSPLLPPPSPLPSRFPLLTILIATLMITPLTRLLWDRLPLLPFTQFPWRFLSIQALGIALLMGSLALLPWRRWLVAATAVLLLVSSLGNLKTDYLVLSDSDINAGRLAQYEWFTGNIGTTVSAEYLPPTVQPRPVTSPWLIGGQRWPVTSLTGEPITAVLTQQDTTHQSWQIETAAAASLIFPTLHWPGWQAEIDGQKTTIQAAPSSGLIMLTVPPGSHTIQLRLTRTPIRLIAELISLTALLLTVALWWYTRRITYHVSCVTYHVSCVTYYVSGIMLLLGLLLIALLTRLWPEPDLPADNLTWDFAQMGYLQHGSVPFNNGGILQSYSYSSETARPQQPFRLSLNWQGASSQATVNLHTPAIHRAAAAPALASQTQWLQPGANEFSFNLPDNVPAGLIMPQLVLADGRPLMPSGRLRGTLFLRPLRVTSVELTADHSRLDIRLLAGQRRTGDVLDLQLAWFTPRSLSRNYNLSLRLVDINGLVLSQFDSQPGYGFLPSSSWQPGQWHNDWLALPLPHDAPLADTALVLHLYDVASQEVVLTRRLGELDAGGNFQPHEPLFVLPPGIERTTAVFGDIIQLQGYQLEQADDTLHLTLFWQALGDGQGDYTRFVHLVEAGATGPPLSQNDGLPRHNSYPTSQWTAGEIISDTVTLPLLNVPPGDYQIVAGFYEPTGDLPRLTAADASGTPLPNNAAPLSPTIVIP